MFFLYHILIRGRNYRSSRCRLHLLEIRYSRFKKKKKKFSSFFTAHKANWYNGIIFLGYFHFWNWSYECQITEIIFILLFSIFLIMRSLFSVYTRDVVLLKSFFFEIWNNVRWYFAGWWRSFYVVCLLGSGILYMGWNLYTPNNNPSICCRENALPRPW